MCRAPGPRSTTCSTLGATSGADTAAGMRLALEALVFDAPLRGHP